MKSKKEICHEFGKRIRNLRKKQEMTQRDLAEQVGVHVSFLGDVERGTKGCGIETIVRIAEALRVKIFELFPNEEYPEELLDLIFWYRLNQSNTLHEILQGLAIPRMRSYGAKRE